MRIKSILFSLIFVLSITSGRANTDERNWSFKSGEKLRAEQRSYDSASGEVVLIIGDTEERIVQFEDLSPIDQAWLVEWNQIEQEMNVLIEVLGGRFEHYVAEGEYSTDFYVYHPSSGNGLTNRPMLLLFNASGQPARYMKQFAEAAENHGIILVGCGFFRNTGPDEQLEKEMLARFKEMLPVIESTVPHDPERLFMGGNSGGAWRAYHYSAWIDRPWAGIYANAGWIGGYDYYDLAYPSGMRIAMVNGNNDHTNRWLERDGELLSSKGNTVVVFSFDGGHQPAPPKSRSKALEWLINEGGAYD